MQAKVKLKSDNSNWWEWYQSACRTIDIKCGECGHGAGVHGSEYGDTCHFKFNYGIDTKRYCNCVIFKLESLTSDIDKMRKQFKRKLNKGVN